ncbi:unnamed protein product [Caenorhabditis bovis]|uniref:protein-serine/threonine phosphatase n=1 Tax=Caenorhabditis bovis TaxID=2654633 RepID=A0A8S1ER59_9PELO|nr:unnamed protein product [Caenorhabditis bovis]
MGAYLNKPIVEKSREVGDGNGLKYACTTMQGWRANQEDAHNCVINIHNDWNMFAVYDGHGGSEVAKFTADKFPNFLKERKFWEEDDIEACLQKAFVDFDDFLRSENAMKDLAYLANPEKADKGNESEDEADRIETIEESSLPLHELIKKYGFSAQSNGVPLAAAFAKHLRESEGTGDDEEYEDEEDEEEEEDVEENKEGEENEKEEGQEAENGESKNEAETKKQVKKRCSKSPIQLSAKKSKSDENSEEQAADIKEGSAEVKGEDDDEDEEDHDFVAEEEEEDEDEEEEFSEDEDESDLSRFMLGSGAEVPGDDSGTTACVCLMNSEKIIVANAGDSRAVLCRAGKAVDLSVDHKPEDEGESQRIHAAGGTIEDGRVNGGLNLSRALGDHSYKKNTDIPLKDQMISALPDVKIEKLTPEDEFLIVACDGIWNSMDSQQVVDFARDLLSRGKSCTEVCDALCDVCLADSTDGDGTGCDNMTVICTQFVR